ncbi:F-box only protein 28 [Culicoides brevitarsis]|uniref:F-box only protein 28 n=1 Tax=Culicoides brevitarsis TaxID=469753 RepID=UPI00307BE10D
MVSTRQMATIISPGANGNEYSVAIAANRSPAQQHHFSPSSASAASSINAITNDSNDDIIMGESAPNSKAGELTLQDLPPEILEKILSYTSYKRVGQLRLVSARMNAVCSSILNSTFNRLQTQMLKRFQEVKAKMPRRESARRNHPLACECDILETCSMRLQLLQMTFGKHIERKHVCFFPGSILDEVYSVVHYIRTTPKLERPYKVTDELFDLSTMAMEYFKDQLEPHLPNVCLSKDFLDFPVSNSPSYMAEAPAMRESSRSPSPPQSNMVLRKGIRKIKQGMKRYNNQLTVLRNELRTCKRKATDQAKQIAEQQKLLAETQKQTLEYANRLDENDKKNEEIARKFSTLLQELNKCKTELQYWRSKSPATPVCQTCGRVIIPVPTDDMQALAKAEDQHGDIEMEDAETANFNNSVPDFKLFESQPLSPIHITSYAATTPVTTRTSNGFAAPKAPEGRKRKLIETETDASAIPSTSKQSTSTAISEKSDNSTKIRRVQNKIRSQYNGGNVNSNNNSKETTTTMTAGPSNVTAGNNGNKTRNNNK